MFDLTENSRKHRRKIIRVAVVAIVLVLGWHLWRSFGGKKMAGIYLADGGRGLFVIEHNPLTGLKIVEGSFVMGMPGVPAMSRGGSKMTWEGDGVAIAQTDRFADPTQPKNKAEISLKSFLVPSLSLGDWDLVEAHGTLYLQGSGAMLAPNPRYAPGNRSGIIKRILQAIAARSSLQDFLKYDRSNPPIKSFFHRIDDKRLIDYFRSRREEGPTQEQWDLLKAILKDHPGDPYLQLHDIEMEALVGDAGAAWTRLEEWREGKRQDPRDPLYQAARMVAMTVSLERAIDKGYARDSVKNSFAGTAAIPSTLNMEERSRWLESLLDYGSLTPEAFPLVIDPNIYASYEIPNFLEIQVQAKIANVMATLDLFEGRREEGLRLWASTYRLGQSMNAGGPLITRLIGIAIRGIASSGLRTYVLDACETPEDFETCWKVLEELNNVPGQETGEYLIVGEFMSFLAAMPLDEEVFANTMESQERHHTADMRFQLVRTALVARYHLVKAGEFPKSEEEFAPLFASGLPRDAFSPGGLKFTAGTPDLYSVYSVGPDRRDDGAAIEYDSTNGTISRGDIYVRIPRERSFPFPRDGVRAKNAYELLNQFPNGLPTDPFARGMYGKIPLSIIESATGTPVFIFSCGPDQYVPDKSSDLVSTPPIAPDAPLSRYEQRVFLPASPAPAGDTGAPLPPGRTPPGPGPYPESMLQQWRNQSRFQEGNYLLGPRYDPTNGTTSDGDLFIEIPRGTPIAPTAD